MSEVTCDYTKAANEAFKLAEANGLTIRAIAIAAGVTEVTVSRAKKGVLGHMTTWAAIIMACGYAEIHCVLRPKTTKEKYNE